MSQAPAVGQAPPPGSPRAGRCSLRARRVQRDKVMQDVDAMMQWIESPAKRIQAPAKRRKHARGSMRQAPLPMDAAAPAFAVSVSPADCASAVPSGEQPTDSVAIQVHAHNEAASLQRPRPRLDAAPVTCATSRPCGRCQTRPARVYQQSLMLNQAR